MSACNSCQARIVWMKTTNGKNIPIDAEAMGGWDAPSIFADGNLRPVEGKSGVVEYVKAGEGKWKTHFVSCPERDEWRKR